MSQKTDDFIDYMREIRKISTNTAISYRHDVDKFRAYLEKEGVVKLSDLTVTTLNAYLLFLENSGYSAATVARNIASVRSYFKFLLREKEIETDFSEDVKPPKVKRESAAGVPFDDVRNLLRQPDGKTPKSLRDKAMIELICDTGIQVSDLIELKLSDVNLDLGYARKKAVGDERIVPISKSVTAVLKDYLENGRPILAKGCEREEFFLNCYKAPISRQGFWKLVKEYAKEANVSADITLHTLHHYYVANKILKDSEIKSGAAN